MTKDYGFDETEKVVLRVTASNGRKATNGTMTINGTVQQIKNFQKLIEAARSYNKIGYFYPVPQYLKEELDNVDTSNDDLEMSLSVYAEGYHLYLTTTENEDFFENLYRTVKDRNESVYEKYQIDYQSMFNSLCDDKFWLDINFIEMIKNKEVYQEQSTLTIHKEANQYHTVNDIVEHVDFDEMAEIKEKMDNLN